jgi:hypothetical protein
MALQEFKRYLGDGVDMNYDGQHVILTMPEKGRVYLKPPVLNMLEGAIKELKSEIRRSKRRLPPDEYFRRHL